LSKTLNLLNAVSSSLLNHHSEFKSSGQCRMASVTMNTGTEDDKKFLELVMAVEMQFLI